MSTSDSVKRYLYLALLVTFGGAATIRLTVFIASIILSFAGVYSLTWSCPVPFICHYHDPVSRMLEYLVPTRPAYLLPWYFAYAAAVLIVVLFVRRLWSFWSARRVAVPASFSGFIYGLAILGAVLNLLTWFGLRSYLLLGSSSEHLTQLGIGFLFLAFLLTELGSLRGDSQASAAEHTIAPRRRPMWGIAALALPLIALALAFLAFNTLGKGDGFAVMGALAVGGTLVTGGLGLGAIAVLIAIWRKERWVPLQVFTFAVNLGIGLPLILHLLPFMHG